MEVLVLTITFLAGVPPTLNVDHKFFGTRLETQAEVETQMAACLLWANDANLQRHKEGDWLRNRVISLCAWRPFGETDDETINRLSPSRRRR